MSFETSVSKHAMDTQLILWKLRNVERESRAQASNETRENYFRSVERSDSWLALAAQIERWHRPTANYEI